FKAFAKLMNSQTLLNYDNGYLQVVGTDFKVAKRELTKRKSSEVNPRLTHHRTPPCNMYCVSD
ncbi:MAG: hypothetical protein R2757_22025, partial [Draconibacterium sp.]